MANKSLFAPASASSPTIQPTTAINAAGAGAFSLADEAALAQLACTGTFSGTFYATAETTLSDLLERAKKVSPEFLAKLAVYSRTRGFMKDSSALLLAVLMTRNIELFKKNFGRVIDNGKMLRTFVQIVRSGQVGRKSFGTAPKRMIRQWLEARTDRQLFEDSVGNDPSLVDVIKMVHPKPASPEREAFYAWLINKPVKNMEALPKLVVEFEKFKKDPKGTRTVPGIPFQMLTALDLSTEEWTSVAKNMKWHALRMNLNTLERHGVLKNEEMVAYIAGKLRSERDVKFAKVFPYQLFTAYLHIGSGVPQVIRDALGEAMEHATTNVPRVKGKVFVGVDFSGSMTAAVTGNRGTATTAVTCNQVASLMAACLIRNSDDCTVYRFDEQATHVQLNPQASVLANAKLIGANGGGTDCGAMLRVLNAQKATGDVVFILSDTESWANHYAGRSTNLNTEWNVFKRRNPNAKLVCIDLAANTTSQVPVQKDILNVGGFGDSVFEVVNAFLEGDTAGEHWVNRIMEEVPL